MEEKENIILKLSFDFALSVISYCELLEELKKFVIAKQLLRSGTSIGACVNEAQNCESNADFIHKLKIAAKEASETRYWLLLCKEAPNYPTPDLLLEKLESIQKVLSKNNSNNEK